MNRIFTSVMLMAAAMFASAGTFTVRDGEGHTYANGDVVNVGYTFNGIDYDWQPDLEVVINDETSPFGGSSLSVTVSASEPGVVMFCGLTGACTAADVTPETRTVSCTKGQVVPLLIDILGSQKLDSEIVVTLKVTDGKETVNLTINFLTTEAGIDAVAASQNVIAFSGRTMHYNVGAATKFALFNISGRTVVDRTLSGSGSLNFAAYPAGVYVYRLGERTGKTLLK